MEDPVFDRTWPVLEDEACRNCGAACRVEAVALLQGTELRDAYSGRCGVNWGYVIPKREVWVKVERSTRQVREERRASRPSPYIDKRGGGFRKVTDGQKSPVTLFDAKARAAGRDA